MNNNSLATEARSVLIQLVDCINQLNFDEYTQKINLLSNSTIGEHTRHIIELFQQLNAGYEITLIDYDNRNRNLKIQSDISYAIECMAEIISCLEKKNKKLFISTFNSTNTLIETNYDRELMYNIEHCIHHQAIIKIGLLILGKENFHDNFGVAKSTQLYKEQCAQ